jgi:hypothetical protein
VIYHPWVYWAVLGAWAVAFTSAVVLLRVNRRLRRENEALRREGARMALQIGELHQELPRERLGHALRRRIR